MPKYLTIQQYKNADDGISLANLTDLALARYISRAESDIDSYCGFDLYHGGFEPHKVMTQSDWDEKRLRTLSPNHPVPVRQVTRYRIQVSNLSTSGAGFFADINPADAVVNVTRGYVEIVPLQAITYSLSPVILQLALKPPIVQMDSEVGWFLPAFGDELLNDGDSLTYRSLRNFWLAQASEYTQALASRPDQLPTVPPAIYADGILLDPSLYGIDAREGSITFSTARLPSERITGDYCYQIPDNIRDATILQTSYLLGQRTLNQSNMQGLSEVRSGKQAATRLVTGVHGSLVEAAAEKLNPYITIPLG